MIKPNGSTASPSAQPPTVVGARGDDEKAERMRVATMQQLHAAVTAYQRGEDVGVFTDAVRQYLRYQVAA